MSNLFKIRFESKDFSECSGTNISGAGSQIAATEQAALCGSKYGCQVRVANVAGATAYFYKDMTLATDDLRWSFPWDPHSVVMATNDEYNMCYIRSSNGVATLGSILHNKSATSQRIRISAREDDNTALFSSSFDVSDTCQCIEVHLERASSGVAGDGRMRIWVDGVLKQTINDVDNYDIFQNADRMYFGFYSGVEVGTDGICYYDEITVNDDAGAIGCPMASITSLLSDPRNRWISEVEFIAPGEVKLKTEGFEDIDVLAEER